MTNGEKIQTILDVDRDCTEVHGENGTMTFTVTQDFWNAEYKEPSGDLINRKAVNEIINDIRDCISVEGYWAILERMKKLPSVNPQEPKIGHWIAIDEEPHEDYECDKCGYTISTYTANIEPHTEYKYCPNCGCRMESEE